MVSDALEVPGEWTYLLAASPQTVSKAHGALQPHVQFDSVYAATTLRSPTLILSVHTAVYILEICRDPQPGSSPSTFLVLALRPTWRRLWYHTVARSKINLVPEIFRYQPDLSST